MVEETNTNSSPFGCLWPPGLDPLTFGAAKRPWTEGWVGSVDVLMFCELGEVFFILERQLGDLANRSISSFSAI